MNILLVAPQPFYEERGTPIAVRWVVETLCRAGHSVDLLCYHRGTDINEKGLNIIRAYGPARIKTIPIGFSLAKLICDVFLACKMAVLLRKNSYDVVHAVEEAVFPALWLRRLAKKNVRLVFDMDSSMPDQIMEKWPGLRRLQKFMNSFERFAVRRADLVLPVCLSLYEKVMSYGPKGRVCILHDRALEDVADAASQENLREELQIKGPVMLYVGNLEHYQGIGLLLDALNQVKSSNGWHMVIIGGKTNDIEHYRERAHEMGLDECVTFLGPRPVNRLQHYLGQADILMSPRLKGVNTPLKVYSYMLAGKAIIATDILSHTQVLDDQCALLTNAETQKFAAGIEELLENENLRIRLGSIARERAEARHTKKAYEKTLLSAYTFDMFVNVEKTQKNSRENE